MITMSNEEIGAGIRSLRGERSQQSIAAAMREHGWKWSQATVWGVETGERPIKYMEALSLAEILGVEPADLGTPAPNEDAISAELETNFAANMKKSRENLGLSQSEVAIRMQQAGWAGFRQATVSRVEKMERTVRLGEAYSIARILGLALWEMTEEGALSSRITAAAKQAQEAAADLYRLQAEVRAAEDKLKDASELEQVLRARSAIQMLP